MVAGATSPTKLGMSFVIPLWDLKLLKERWRRVGADPPRLPCHDASNSASWAFRWGREMQSRFSFDRVRLPTIGTQALPGRRHPIFAILWPNDHPKVCICIPNSSPQKFLRWVPNLYESVSPCPVTLQICCRHASSFSTRRTSSAGGSYVAFDIVWQLPVAHAFGMPTHADSSCSGCDVVKFGVVKWKSRQVAYRLRRSTVQEVNY